MSKTEPCSTLQFDGEPVFQSRRLEMYRTAFERLRATGRVYPCFCTRSEIARAVDAVARAGPRAIMLAVPLTEPSDTADLARVRSFLDGAETTSDPAMRARLQAWVTELDHDSDLERALGRAGNVLLLATRGAPVLERFASTARAVGFEPAAPPDADGVSRRDRLYTSTAAGTAVPSLSFAACTRSSGGRRSTPVIFIAR